MRRSRPIDRKTPLRRSTVTSGVSAKVRRGLLASIPKRDWSEALAKVEAEGRCRVCRVSSQKRKVDAAHTLGRRYDRPGEDGVIVVRAVDTCPMCRPCHGDYDAHRLDLVPHLSHAEMAAAVGHVGIVSALRRLQGRRDSGLAA